MDTLNFQRFTRSFSENLDPPVRNHLKNVYSTFTLACITASAGSYAHMFSSLIGAGLLTGIGASGTFLWLISTPHNNKNHIQRLTLLGLFTFFCGCNLGPLLQLAIAVNPAVIIQALLGTSVIFACFSMAALFAPRGYYLYLGGPLLAALSTLIWLSLLNFIFASQLLFQVNLYIGFAVMCGLIVFDTQVIIEKACAGERDYIRHSLDLFIDFIAVFKRLLIILTNKEAQSKKRNRN